MNAFKARMGVEELDDDGEAGLLVKRNSALEVAITTLSLFQLECPLFSEAREDFAKGCRGETSFFEGKVVRGTRALLGFWHGGEVSGSLVPPMKSWVTKKLDLLDLTFFGRIY